MQILLVLSLLFAALVAVFALQNAQTVPIKFFMWQPEASVAVIVLLFAAAGAFIAAIVGLIRQVKQGLRLRQLKAQLAATNEQLEDAQRALKEANDKLKILEEQYVPRIITVRRAEPEHRKVDGEHQPLPDTSDEDDETNDRFEHRGAVVPRTNDTALNDDEGGDN